MADVLNEGFVRTTTESGDLPSGIGGVFKLNPRGEQITAAGLPPLTELVRMGNSWQVQTATPAAALTTEPTTTAALSIWNGNASGNPGIILVIDSVAAIERVVDVTQQNQLALFAMNSVVPVAAPTATALTIRSLSGKAYGGKVRPVAGLTVTNDGWFPIGNTTPNAAAVAGGAWRVTDVDLKGMHIIQPGGLFSLHAAKIAATASQINFVIRWHEVSIAYG